MTKKSPEARAWEVSYRATRTQMARHDTEMRKAAKRGDKEAMVEHRNQVLRLSGHLKMLRRTTPQGATP